MSGKKFDSRQGRQQIFSKTEIESMLRDYKLYASNLAEISKEAYWQVGMKIQENAAKMCPVDTGTMQTAIELEEYESRYSYRVYLTYNGSIGYDRYSDGRTVEDVIYYIHELIQPEGPKNLGPKSEAKQGAVWPLVVGGGFLRRAMEDTSEISDAINDYVSEKIRQLGIQKYKYRYKKVKGKKVRIEV